MNRLPVCTLYHPYLRSWMYKEKVSDHEALKEGVQQALAVGGVSRHFSFWRKFQGGALEG